ncbi:MFS transporter [Actinomadura vinacea]|uniref:MFS transporter n=1 Tax=Actinomadura vinacea TaxID=115336 RepID=A0ABN3JXL0_9ACTN
MSTATGPATPPTDPASEASEPVPEDPAGVLGRRYRTATLGVVLVVMLMAFESMAVTTVMPVVARDLDGLALYAWGFSATLIAGVPANVLAGGWVDRSGPTRPMLTGLAAFVAGLVIAGVAADMWTFVAGRAVQGLGTGIAMVAVYVLIARVYPDRLRSRVFAALSAAWVLPSLVGPAVGGAAAQHLGWRWVFLGLVPLVVPPTVMLIPVMRGLRRSRPSDGAGTRAGRRYLGAIAAAVGAAALLYGLDHPGWAVVPLIAAGLAGLAAGLPPLLPAGTLRMRRGLPSIVLVRGLLSGAFLGMDVFIPLALTSLHGFSPTKAGLVLTVSALGWTAASQFQGRSSRPRAFFVLVGAVLLTMGIVTSTLVLQVTGWPSALTWTIGGAGMGFAIGSISVLLLDLSPEEEQGANSSALQIADTLGGSLVVGVAGALVTAFGTHRLAQALGVAGALLAAIAVVGIIAALRLEARATGFGALRTRLARGARSEGSS